MTDTVFRLTWNKPAGKAFLEGVTGVRIAVEGRTVRFRPVANFKNHSDAVQIVQRGDEAKRGGYEARIEGKRAAELLKVMQRLATPRQPFFLLAKQPDGWLSITHFNKDGNPPKFEPHVRFWSPREQNDVRVRRRADRDIEALVSTDPALAFAKRIKECAIIVNDYHATRRIGRPPAEVNEAQSIMAFFDRLVQQVRPIHGLEGKIDFARLKDFRDFLDGLVALKDAPIKDESAEDEEASPTRRRATTKTPAKASPPAKTGRGRSSKSADRAAARERVEQPALPMAAPASERVTEPAAREAKAPAKEPERAAEPAPVAAEPAPAPAAEGKPAPEPAAEAKPAPTAKQPEPVSGENVRETQYVRDEYAQINAEEEVEAAIAATSGHGIRRGGFSSGRGSQRGKRLVHT